METDNIPTDVIYNIKTDEYSVYCEERVPNVEYFCEVFVRFNEGIRYMVHVYFEKPTITQMLIDTIEYGQSSRRPYKAGQSCDGSISSPVFHLYLQLCKAFNFDPIASYRLAYPDTEFTQEDLEDMVEFAEWQGVEIIQDWNLRNVFRVLESLTEVNYHSLRNVLEEKLESSF